MDRPVNCCRRGSLAPRYGERIQRWQDDRTLAFDQNTGTDLRRLCLLDAESCSPIPIPSRVTAFFNWAGAGDRLAVWSGDWIADVTLPGENDPFPWLHRPYFAGPYLAYRTAIAQPIYRGELAKALWSPSDRQVALVNMNTAVRLRVLANPATPPIT